MLEPFLIDLGWDKVLFVDANYEFDFVLCRAGHNCIEYTKKASELDNREISLIKGELIKQQLDKQ